MYGTNHSAVTASLDVERFGIRRPFLLLGVVLLFTISVSRAAAPPGSLLETLISRLMDFKTLHYRARWDFKSLKDDGTQGGSVIYEEWSEGNKFRVSGTTKDIRTGEGYLFDVAYDGRQFQMVLPHRKDKKGIFTYSSKVPESNILLRPAAVLLPLEFLSRYGDQCDACSIQVQNANEAERVKDIIKASEYADSADGSLVIRSPGSVLFGQEYNYFTHLNRDDGH